MEAAMLKTAAAFKEINPDLHVGMYWRTDFNLELGDCSNGAAEWKAHPEWQLRDDQGNIVLEHGSGAMFDYSNASFREFFTNVLLDVMKATLPSGKVTMNYLYLDGPDANPTQFAPGINPNRSAVIYSGKMSFFANLQLELDALGQDQIILLNGVDTFTTAAEFQPTGAGGVMVDHFTILQFLNSTTGEFLVGPMNDVFNLIRSETLGNMTQFIKGWPGPIIEQRDIYPPNLPQPVTRADFKQVAGDRFNSELALFLLVAEDHMFWQYSWFWGFDDWVPNQPDSSVPDNFFPQTKCQLGEPKGTLVTSDNVTFTREFEYASVWVNLNNRTDSKVTFTGKC